MRNILPLVVLILASHRGNAGAEAPAPAAPRLALLEAPKHDASFRSWVLQRAKETDGGVSEWGWAQLDDDPAPERFAILCEHKHENGSNEEECTRLVLLIEDTPGKRWSLPQSLDGRNSCNVTKNPPWKQTELRSTLDLTTHYHGSHEVISIALRHGQPTQVRTVYHEHEFHGGQNSCYEDSLDYETLERRYEECPSDKPGVPAISTRAALFVLGGESGRYQRKLTGAGELPSFTVAVTPLSAVRLRVLVNLQRAARVGEAIEIWTTTSFGKPLAWSALWDGTHWKLRGLLRAPRELPPVEGDARSMSIPIVKRPDSKSELETELTVVAVSADRKTRVATSDLRADIDRSFGLVINLPGPPKGLRVE